MGFIVGICLWDRIPIPSGVGVTGLESYPTGKCNHLPDSIGVIEISFDWVTPVLDRTRRE
jgi:hypothetical protein